jgi:hypothetical protein
VDLSTLTGTYQDSAVSWRAFTPGSSTVQVQRATDQETFSVITNGGNLGLTIGQSFLDVSVTLKVTLTSSGADFPAVTDLAFWVETSTATSPALTNTRNWFKFGYVKWLTGENKNLSMEVKEWDNVTSQITLFLPMPRPIVANDQFEITPGCNRSLFTCKNKFNNVNNFRGEPYIPGQDTLLRIVSEGTPPALTEQANEFAKQEADLDVTDP